MMLGAEVGVETTVEPKVINIQYIFADKLIYHEQVEVNANNGQSTYSATPQESILTVGQLDTMKSTLKKEKPAYMTEEQWLDY